MDENQIRKIVRDEIAKAAQTAQYGVARVPVHTHNNIDAPNIPPHSVAGFQYLPGKGPGSDGVLSSAVDQDIVGPPADTQVLNPPSVAVFPVPIIYGHGVGVASAFNGGDAPAGTVIMFDNAGSATLAHLYVKTENGWAEINVNAFV